MSKRRKIAVFHTGTGLIKQVVNCPECDAEKQHQRFADHSYLDVTDTFPDTNANKHQVDLSAKTIVARVAPLFEVKFRAVLAMNVAAEAEETAAGDQQDLIAEATVGGQPERNTLAVYMTAKKARAGKLQNLTDQITAATSNNAVAKITW